MMLYRLERVVRVRAPLERVWEFFADPRNLPEITPPWLRFRIVSPVPARMYPGLLIEYRVRPFWWEVAWVSEITHVEDGVRFVDEQRVGPYRLWHHEHHFRRVGGQVEVRDLVLYALPGGRLGRRVAGRAVQHRLRAIFDYRERAVLERFGGQGWKAPAGGTDGCEPRCGEVFP